MKKIFVFAALLAAAFFVVSCGGSENDNNSGGNEQVCSYGSYRCEGTSSYFCGYSNNELLWILAEVCNNGCNSVTGQCSNGSNNNGGGSDSPAADNSYNANYGFISLNFAFDGIGNADDNGFGSSSYGYGFDYTSTAFATGTYGNGSAAINPANAAYFAKQAVYYSSANSIWVAQNPVFQNGIDTVGGNPAIDLYINANQASVGKMSVGVEGNNVQLFVVEHNWSTHQDKCIHAFAEGQINISKLGDLVYHGSLELTGALQLYSPKNYKGQDISGKVKSQLGLETCPVVY